MSFRTISKLVKNTLGTGGADSLGTGGASSIQVKAIAVNPVDRSQRDDGFPPVPIYPGVVALASSFYQNGSADHGAFQQYTLAQTEGVALLPDSLSFEEGAVFPLAVLTALSGYTTMGIPLDTSYTASDKQAILIWGASSSVGTIAVQSAKIMVFNVYATAGIHNFEYVKELGADAAFDYRSTDVVSQIVSKAKADNVTLRTAHVVVAGSLQQTLDVLKQTQGNGSANVAHAPLLPADMPTLEGAEVRFTLQPMDPTERSKHMHRFFNIWLKDGLESGAVVASPRSTVVPGGLDGLNDALDKYKTGVSATKLVVSL